MNAHDLVATHEQLVRAWQVTPHPESGLDYDILLEELQERVVHLLRENPRKLLNALYILDISERRYAQAMDQPTMEDRAWDLARAILERESEKILIRRRFAEEMRGDSAPKLPEEGMPQ